MPDHWSLCSFWYHRVAYKTPCHASDLLVITAIAMDLRECFQPSAVFYLTLLPSGFKTSLGAGSSTKVSRASCWSSKHSPSPAMCFNHNNRQKKYAGRFYLRVTTDFCCNIVVVINVNKKFSIHDSVKKSFISQYFKQKEISILLMFQHSCVQIKINFDR